MAHREQIFHPTSGDLIGTVHEAHLPPQESARWEARIARGCGVQRLEPIHTFRSYASAVKSLVRLDDLVYAHRGEPQHIEKTRHVALT